jgi:hypothetical protein
MKTQGKNERKIFKGILNEWGEQRWNGLNTFMMEARWGWGGAFLLFKR